MLDVAIHEVFFALRSRYVHACLLQAFEIRGHALLFHVLYKKKKWEKKRTSMPRPNRSPGRNRPPSDILSGIPSVPPPVLGAAIGKLHTIDEGMQTLARRRFGLQVTAPDALPPDRSIRSADTTLQNFRNRVAKHMDQWINHYGTAPIDNPLNGANPVMTAEQAKFVSAMSKFAQESMTKGKGKGFRSPRTKPVYTNFCLRFLECVCAENKKYIDRMAKAPVASVAAERALFANSMLLKCSKYLTECRQATDTAPPLMDFTVALVALFEAYAEFELSEPDFLDVDSTDDRMDYDTSDAFYRLTPSATKQRVNRLKWKTVLVSNCVTFVVIHGCSMLVSAIQGNEYNHIRSQQLRPIPNDFFSSAVQENLTTLFPFVPSRITADCFAALKTQPHAVDQVDLVNNMLMLNITEACIPLTFYGGRRKQMDVEIFPVGLIEYEEKKVKDFAHIMVESCIFLGISLPPSSASLQEAYDIFTSNVINFERNGLRSLQDIADEVEKFTSLDKYGQKRLRVMVAGHRAFFDACSIINAADPSNAVFTKTTFVEEADTSSSLLAYAYPMLEFMKRPTLLKWSVVTTHFIMAFHQNSWSHRFATKLPLLHKMMLSSQILASFVPMNFQNFFNANPWVYSHPEIASWLSYSGAVSLLELVMFSIIDQDKAVVRIITSRIDAYQEWINRRFLTATALAMAASVTAITLQN